MFNYEPSLLDLNGFKNLVATKKGAKSKDCFPKENISPQGEDPIVLTNKSKHKNNEKNHILLFNLPPAVNNSTLVRQRASAKNLLAATSVTTGASLPLMIGGRSKCVINSIEADSELGTDEGADSNRRRFLVSPSQLSSLEKPTCTTMSHTLMSNAGPKNTALRAEQRKQGTNMVSVVRPVMASAAERVNFDQQADLTRKKLDGHDSDFTSSSWQCQVQLSGGSILDDFIQLEQRINSNKLASSATMHDLHGTDMLMMEKLNFHSSEPTEVQQRQQLALFRREEFELNRFVRKNHRFFILKIEERRRNLLIIQSLWFQRDLKHAIEKLVDIYHQGLIFTTDCDYGPIKANQPQRFDDINRTSGSKTILNSLNTSLVVDVLSVLILRPRLWSLDICQLVLPILNNDLLVQYQNKVSKENNMYEYYSEIGLKTLKLILTNFSSVIKTTIETQKECAKLLTGVDLSREDRLNKCLNCYKLLLESKAIIVGSSLQSTTIKHRTNQPFGGKFGYLYRELEQLLSLFSCSPSAAQSSSSSSSTSSPSNSEHRVLRSKHYQQQTTSAGSVSTSRRAENQ